MADTQEIRTISAVVKLGTRGDGSWFRGHATACRKLIPKIFRSQYHEPRRRNPWFECRLIQEFQRMGVRMASDPPPADDNLGWLYLMQHYGAPTRLLDWTENVLVALYFAVEDSPERDGEFWILNPHALNKKSGVEGVPCNDEVDDTLKWLVSQPCAQHLNAEDLDRIKYPCAIRPAMYVSRMISQLGVFTIHPAPPKKPAKSTTDSFSDSDVVVRYIVPRACKPKLFTDLAALGITRRALFDDLDALAKTVVATVLYEGATAGES